MNSTTNASTTTARPGSPLNERPIICDVCGLECNGHHAKLIAADEHNTMIVCQHCSRRLTLKA